MKFYLNQITKSIFTTIILLGSVVAIAAQTDQGRVSGTVSDEAGAVVAGATVTIKNNGTNQTRTAATDNSGYYFVPSLNAAFYTVMVNAPNFAATTVTDVQLSVSQHLDLPLKLTVAGQTVAVEVTAASEAAIDTSSARIGATVNQREVEDLPINGRQLSQLYLQAPGTVNSGTGTYGDIRFSGRANQQNVIRYDGVEGTAIIDASPGNLNGEVASPFRLQSSLENVQEFRADSNNFPAEYGTGTGGQISQISFTVRFLNISAPKHSTRETFLTTPLPVCRKVFCGSINSAVQSAVRLLKINCFSSEVTKVTEFVPELIPSNSFPR